MFSSVLQKACKKQYLEKSMAYAAFRTKTLKKTDFELNRYEIKMISMTLNSNDMKDGNGIRKQFLKATYAMLFSRYSFTHAFNHLSISFAVPFACY